MSCTVQSASLDTNTGKGLLRKIVRQQPTWGDEWKLRAGENTGWKVVFERRVSGELGEPDAEVVVETDSVVTLQGATGRQRPFADRGCEVTVPATRGVWLYGQDVKTVAKFLLDGWHLTVTHCCGSIHSSEFDIASAYLCLCRGCERLQIGSATTYVKGDCVIGGACYS